MDSPAPQRLCKFRRGTKLRFGRWLGALPGQAMMITWTNGPHCLVRSGFSAASLMSPGPGTMLEIRASLETARLRGATVTPSADAIVAIHEHPLGARLAIFDVRGQRATVAYRDRREDLPLATNGRTIVVSAHEAPHLSSFDWDLRERRTWSLEPLRAQFGDPCDGVPVVQSLGDTVLVGTGHTWSRWSWDAQLLDAWPIPTLPIDPTQPRIGVHSPWLVAWDDRLPLLMMMVDRTDHHLVEWDFTSRTGRSLGATRGWPKAARSHTRQLLVDRVAARGGRGLELWEPLAGEPAERLETSRYGVSAMAFAPSSGEIAVATASDLFTMHVPPPSTRMAVVPKPP